MLLRNGICKINYGGVDSMSEKNEVRFAKKCGANLFKVVGFVVKARAKNNRMVLPLKYVKIHAGNILATDGDRLHMAAIGDYQDGVYEVVLANASEIILIDTGTTEWPDYRVVVDAAANGSHIIVPLSGHTGINLARINRAMDTSEAISPDFVAATCGFAHIAMITTGRGKPVHFVGEEYGLIEAYIMPLFDR